MSLDAKINFSLSLYHHITHNSQDNFITAPLRIVKGRSLWRVESRPEKYRERETLPPGICRGNLYNESTRLESGPISTANCGSGHVRPKTLRSEIFALYLRMRAPTRNRSDPKKKQEGRRGLPNILFTVTSWQNISRRHQSHSVTLLIVVRQTLNAVRTREPLAD